MASEKQLCEALETWLANNNKSLGGSPSNSSSDKFDILKKVNHKISLVFLSKISFSIINNDFCMIYTVFLLLLVQAPEDHAFLAVFSCSMHFFPESN